MRPVKRPARWEVEGGTGVVGVMWQSSLSNDAHLLPSMRRAIRPGREYDCRLHSF